MSRPAVQAVLPGFDAVAQVAAASGRPSHARAPVDAPRVCARRCYPPRSDTASRDYRYRLEIDFAGRDPSRRLLAIGVNPSTADENEDDPTMFRVILRAWRLGFGGLDMGNLFGVRSTDPDLRNFGDPVGPENDGELYRMVMRASGILVAWGNAGLYQGRAFIVGGALDRIAAARAPAFEHCEACGEHLHPGAGICRAVPSLQHVPPSRLPIWCFKVTKEGQPEHPLYQKHDAILKRWIPPLVSFTCGRKRGAALAVPGVRTMGGHLWRSRRHTFCLVCGRAAGVAHLPCPGVRR